MAGDNDGPDEPAIFSALLTPHRSLSGRGFGIVMLIVGTVSFAVSVFFWMLGAWPVVGFFGLDVLVVWLAFRASYRSARAYEEVVVTPSLLRVRQVSHHGRAGQWTFNPLWVRLDRESAEEFGLVRLFIVSRELRVAIARVLGPHDKESFAAALSRALDEARRGPTRTTFE